MRIEQLIERSGAVDIRGRRLQLLDVPSNPPPPFDTGRWRVGRSGVGTSEERLLLRWDDQLGRFKRGKMHIKARDRSDASLWSLRAEFPSSARGEFASPVVGPTTPIFFSIEVEGNDPQVSAVAEQKTLPLDLVNAHFAALTAGPSIQNVVLFFPRSGRPLWTSETLLRQTPYFDTLFSSGFAETLASTSGAEEEVDDEAAPFDDSDDETDTALPKPPSPVASSTFPGIRTIRITEASYSTNLAVICWLQTHHIEFAPLASSFSPSSSASVETSSSKRRLAAILPTSSTPTPFPPLPPVSPKSVYRLSHLLELPTLSSLALSHFRSQLTSANVAYELFSPTSCCYEAVLDACIDFVLKNVKEVFESEGMKEFEERAERGELTVQEGSVWAKLAGTVARGR